MIDIYNFLTSTREKAYEANSVLENLVSKVKKIVELKFFEAYENTTTEHDGKEFKLIGVDVRLYLYPSSIDTTELTITLAYVCISKLPKAKRERLLDAEKQYYKRKRFPCTTSKDMLYYESDYTTTIKAALQNKPNLIIE